MRRGEDGFTLVELLVAASILIVGVATTFAVFDSARKLSLVSERQTTMVHLAQQELERVKSLPYAQIGLTSTSSSWSSTPSDYTYVSNPTGGCPSTSSGAAPTYQPDHSSGGSSATESLVIDGCSYTLNGTSTAYSSGTVAPVTAWSNCSSSGCPSGNIYDFVTYAADPTCASTSSPGSICATSNDYKRVTVVVTMSGVSEPSHPAIVSSIAPDPNAAPPGAPSNSQQNPIQSPTTSCQNGLGQTVSCSNTLNGTPIQYFLSDTPYSGSYSSPSCTGNALHDTLEAVGLTAAAPDQLTTSAPSGNCTDVNSNPTPPCYATDLGCANGTAGLPLTPTGSSTCGSAPASNTKSHAFATPTVPAGSTINLTGTGSMTDYLQTSSSAAVSANLCVGLYIIPGGLLGTLTGNLLAQPIGAAASVSLTVAAGLPTPVSFNFNVGSSAAVTSSLTNLERIELVVWVAASSGTNVSLLYDQLQYASQVDLITST